MNGDMPQIIFAKDKDLTILAIQKLIKEYKSKGFKNNEITIEVIDNGVGIPKEDQDKIFQRFYRVDKARSRSVGGTGLGLAITKHIVNSLQGNISVESKLGEGSKFIVTIPTKIS